MSATQDLAMTGTSVVAGVVGGVALAAGLGIKFMMNKGAKSAAKTDETPTNEIE